MNVYSSLIAKHYGAYRPPLHQILLQEHLGPNQQFSRGLDIGCGTGQSSVALAKYCSHVVGIDPSMDMLNFTLPHAKVEYRWYNGINIDLPARSFDIVTLAGSLHYMDRWSILNEILGLTEINSSIIVYDFKIFLQPLLRALNIPEDDSEKTYDHRINFCPLNCKSLSLQISTQQKKSFEITPSNLAHLLLSYPYIAQFISNKYDSKNPYIPLVQKLTDHFDQKTHTIPAATFFSSYRVIKNI